MATPDEPKKTRTIVGSAMSPLKFDDERRSKYLEFRRQGVSKKAAAAACGITYQTLRNHELDDPEFAERGKQVELELRAQLELQITKASIGTKAVAGDWRAALVILERRYPEDWARRTRIEGHLDLTRISDDVLLRTIENLSEQLGVESPKRRIES